jgi:hypothetical protein
VKRGWAAPTWPGLQGLGGLLRQQNAEALLDGQAVAGVLVVGGETCCKIQGGERGKKG